MNLTIYVPDALGVDVKAARLNVSKICQDALELCLEMKKEGELPRSYQRGVDGE